MVLELMHEKPVVKKKDVIGKLNKNGNKVLSEKERAIKVKGTIIITKTDAKTGKIKEIKKRTNLVVNKGLQLLCKAMIDSGYTTGITYLALGDNDTAVAPGNTTLTNETFRKIITTRSRSGQTITLSTFIATAEANDTHYEIGFFGNGATITPDSGDMFNHLVLTGGEVKDSSETWTIDGEIEFTNG